MQFEVLRTWINPDPYSTEQIQIRLHQAPDPQFNVPIHAKSWNHWAPCITPMDVYTHMYRPPIPPRPTLIKYCLPEGDVLETIFALKFPSALFLANIG